ncbi:unnamed protein product [Clonostachys rosea f. rosea IK726]|uniref:CBM1 domain-containing protein n=2 Tax=Bionectria ochroleuca TaxID=29856 RepID=A0A0B7K926_BIOOC|nr:unnamed protein product [Clonostachys rosea f. rosea IK726]
MKFTVLAIAALTTLAAAHLIPEDKKHHVIYSPVGAPRHPEHKLGHLGKPREGHVEVLPSADGDNFKVIKIVPDQHSHHAKPAPVPIKLESRPFKIDRKFDHKGDHKHDHKPCCPFDKHHPKHDHKHDYKPCPYHKHEDKHEHKPCPYHKIEHKPLDKPCPYQKPEHKHEHKLYPIEKLDFKPERKPEHHRPEPHRPEHPKPEPQPTLEGECSPGTYECTFNPKSGAPGWKVCSSSGKWEYGGDCPPNTVCKYYTPSKSPYCVPRYYEFP